MVVFWVRKKITRHLSHGVWLQKEWLFFLTFIGVQLLYDVVLVSAVQQSESMVCLYRPALFWICFPLRSLNWLFLKERSSLEWTIISKSPESSMEGLPSPNQAWGSPLRPAFCSIPVHGSEWWVQQGTLCWTTTNTILLSEILALHFPKCTHIPPNPTVLWSYPWWIPLFLSTKVINLVLYKMKILSFAPRE